MVAMRRANLFYGHNNIKNKYLFIVALLLFSMANRGDSSNSLPSLKAESVKYPSSVGSRFQKLNVSVITWNLAECTPSDYDCSFLKKFSDEDVVVIGVQVGNY